MKTIDQPDVLDALRSRLEALAPDAQARWGRMSVLQMLVHCADSMERVLGGEDFEGPGSASRFLKFIALNTSAAWPKGLPSGGDPASLAVEEGFEHARTRAVTALEAMAAADGTGFSPAHSAFGAMSRRDWLRWAQRHMDHHLRQFGV